MKSHSHWLHWDVTSNFHCSLHKTAWLSDKAEIILAIGASASTAHSCTLAFLYLGFKSQLLHLGVVIIFFNLQAGTLTKFEIQSVSCSAKLIDLPQMKENIPLLYREDCAFDNSHLLYIGGEEKEKEIKFFNSRPKVSKPEVMLISPIQLFPEYGFTFLYNVRWHLKMMCKHFPRPDWSLGSFVYSLPPLLDTFLEYTLCIAEDSFPPSVALLSKASCR